jgi:predicted nucleic acid-binding protein
MKKIYLDICSLNRPFDDQTQPRIRLEAEAVLWILKKIDAGQYILCGSVVSDYENQANPDFNKQTKIGEILNRATEYATMSAEIEERAEQLAKTSNMKPLDALHVASAESLNAYAMITCDDHLIKATDKLKTRLKIIVINPSDFVRKESN